METEKLQIVEIPYAGKNISMVILLPRTHGDMPALESSLTADQLSINWALITPKKIRLLLPKFHVTSEFELSEVLKKMGMPHPFSLEADLSGMTGRKDLMIDKVVHKAFVNVDEKGTEAAAATAVVIREKNGMVIPEFRADRPFIFIIKENRNSTILFMGRVNDPSL
jgi:serpin B